MRVGQQGLDALGVTQNTSRIALGGGRYRVPDILDEAGGVIGEVKNVQSLSYTSQLRDYISYAQANQLQFDLCVARLGCRARCSKRSTTAPSTCGDGCRGERERAATDGR